MGSFTVGDFALVLSADSLKVVHLKSFQDSDRFFIDWFVFAQEIASFYPDEDLPAFEDCELLHLINNDLPKSIDTSTFLRNCFVQYLSRPDIERPKNCSVENDSYFVRYSFNGYELSVLPEELFASLPTTPQRQLTKKSKKIVRVSFAGRNKSPSSVEVLNKSINTLKMPSKSRRPSMKYYSSPDSPEVEMDVSKTTSGGRRGRSAKRNANDSTTNSPASAKVLNESTNTPKSTSKSMPSVKYYASPDSPDSEVSLFKTTLVGRRRRSSKRNDSTAKSPTSAPATNTPKSPSKSKRPYVKNYTSPDSTDSEVSIFKTTPVGRRGRLSKSANDPTADSPESSKVLIESANAPKSTSKPKRPGVKYCASPDSPESELDVATSTPGGPRERLGKRNANDSTAKSPASAKVLKESTNTPKSASRPKRPSVKYYASPDSPESVPDAAWTTPVGRRGRLSKKNANEAIAASKYAFTPSPVVLNDRNEKKSLTPGRRHGISSPRLTAKPMIESMLSPRDIIKRRSGLGLSPRICMEKMKESPMSPVTNPKTPGSTRKASRSSKTPGSTRKSPRIALFLQDVQTPQLDSPMSAKQILKTPGSGNISQSMLTDTPRTTRQTSRTPQTPTIYETEVSEFSEMQRKPGKVDNLRTPGSTKKPTRSSKTPESSTTSENALMDTPRTTRQSSRTPQTPSIHETEVTVLRRTSRTPGSKSRTVEEANIDTPRSTRQSSRTPQTPLIHEKDVFMTLSSPRSKKTPRTPTRSSRNVGESPSTGQSNLRSTRYSLKTPKTPLVQDEASEAHESAKKLTKLKRSKSKIDWIGTDELEATVHLTRSENVQRKSRRHVQNLAEDLAHDSDDNMAMSTTLEKNSCIKPSTTDDAEEGATYRRSTRACKTAALKALFDAQNDVLMTHTFPGWQAQGRKKVFGRRHSAIAGVTESPLLRVRRLHLEGSRDKRLTGFRQSHRRLTDDSSDDEDYMPGSDSDSDFEEPNERRKRRAPRTASKLIAEENEEVTLPTRMTADGCRSRIQRGCKVRLVECGKELEEAKLRLHVANLGEAGRALTCREEEFQDIFHFVSSRLQDEGSEDGGCMYISGLPGTGKTATVSAVVAALKAAKSSLPSFDLVEVNGMRLTDPQQVYPFVLRQLTGVRATVKHAPQMLDKEFRKRGRRPCLLIVDELDLLCTRRQQVLYNLFDWPQRAAARLTVLAIANTMDLPERLLHQKVASRIGLTRLVFQPYSHQQLFCIVQERLGGLNCFQKEALELTSRKVAAISGDARRALDICRRAAELAEAGTARMVNLKHVDAAIKEMFASSKVRAISECAVYEQMCLRALLAELSRTGLEEAQLDRVVRQMDLLCRCEGLPILTGGEVFTIVVRLSSHKLLLCEHFRQDGKMKLRLNCAQHDVTFSLKDVKYEGVLTME